jgi:hypothetical protein
MALEYLAVYRELTEATVPRLRLVPEVDAAKASLSAH